MRVSEFFQRLFIPCAGLPQPFHVFIYFPGIIFRQLVFQIFQPFCCLDVLSQFQYMQLCFIEYGLLFHLRMLFVIERSTKLLLFILFPK